MKIPSHIIYITQFIGVITSLLSFIYARLAAKRSRVIKDTFRRVNLGQDFHRCYRIASQVSRILRITINQSGGLTTNQSEELTTNQSEELITDLHDEIFGAYKRNSSVISPQDKDDIEMALKNCRSACALIKDNKKAAIEAIKFVSSKCLSISETQKALVNNSLEMPT